MGARWYLLLLATLGVGLPGLAGAQSAASPITTAEIDAHLRFLASDLLEGRAPGTRGDRLTTAYIAGVLQHVGLRPGVGDSYFQNVPIDIITADHRHLEAAATGPATTTLRDPDDIVVWAGSATVSSVARGELVFVGYGIDAPAYRWDDFKDADVRGKVLLELVNDPPPTAAEPALFRGGTMTYYGRWTYKFEEAERRGAAGVLLIHTTASAGYPWHTVVSSWDRTQRMAPRDSSLPPPLGVRGWISDRAATALLSGAGLDLATLRARASMREFQPVSTGITMNIAFRNRVEHAASANVVGLVAGRDPSLASQCVVFSAHWDHLGIGPAVDGDSIYHGAEDNASGVADLLAMARRAAAGPRPRRSLLFVFTTAEESGLLGSAYLATHPPTPAAADGPGAQGRGGSRPYSLEAGGMRAAPPATMFMVADLNIDGGNLFGRVRDLDVLGADKSSLGPALARYAVAHGLRLEPDAHPEWGQFYRSDHFSFARAGVPALSIGAGSDFVGQPPDWGARIEDDYAAHRYHQPSDAYRTGLDLRGAVQLAELVLDFGTIVANDAASPTWNRDAEFRRSTGTTAAEP